jgi:uncharacterized protein
MRRIHWVVKASKLCNLRCRYCYEWDSLADSARMSLNQWETLLSAIRRYHDRESRRTGERTQSVIIWHGGEPLLLPVEYFKQVLDLQHEVFGRRLGPYAEFTNSLQTNLFRLTDEHLEILQDGRFHVGVSYDVVGGIRVTANSRESESRVLRNLSLLRARGMNFGGIVVLAGHTCDQITEIYDFYEQLQCRVRFLPVFTAPGNTTNAPFALSRERAIASLCSLFLHWVSRVRPVVVHPLFEYLQNLFLRQKGEYSSPVNRRADGEYVVLVNTNGDLFQVRDAYHTELRLGNVFEQDLEAILSSPQYEASLARDDIRFRAHCRGCSYLGICDGSPLFESNYADGHLRRCYVAFDLYRFIAKVLKRDRALKRRARQLVDL